MKAEAAGLICLVIGYPAFFACLVISDHLNRAEQQHPPFPAASAPHEDPASVHLARTTDMCDRVFTKEETQRLIDRCDHDRGWVRVEWREVTCWRDRQDFGYGYYPPPMWRVSVSDYPEEENHAALPPWAERALLQGKTLRVAPQEAARGAFAEP